MRRVFGLSALLAVLIVAGCGKKPRVVVPSGPIPMHQEGLASWYGKGDGYQGKKTANGERFDRNKLTAAHFSLPFGTLVKVRNKRNGREVTVRINDRFPVETLRKGRIIDLSYKAAERLHMIRDGVVPVELTVIKLPGNG